MLRRNPLPALVSARERDNLDLSPLGFDFSNDRDKMVATTRHQEQRRPSTTVDRRKKSRKGKNNGQDDETHDGSGRSTQQVVVEQAAVITNDENLMPNIPAIVEEKDRKIADLEAKLQKKLRDEETSKVATIKSTKDDSIPTEELTKVANITKTFLWQTRKFLTTPEEVTEGTAEVYDYYIGHDPKDDPDERKKNAWIAVFRDKVRESCNKRRSYLAQQLKKLAFDLLDDDKFCTTVRLEDGTEKRILLSSQLVLECATRTIANLEIFKWYWNEVLPKIVEKNDWDTCNRYYNKPSKMMNKELKKKMFPSSHEAMIVVMWKNCEVKWVKQWEITKQAASDGRKVTKKEMKMNGKYSSSDKGQRDCGWSKDGLKEYNRIVNLIKDSRKTGIHKNLELLAYNSIRSDHNITQENQAEQNKVNRLRKRGFDQVTIDARADEFRHVSTIHEESDIEPDDEEAE